MAPTWQPTGSGGNGLVESSVRVGTVRSSMNVNPLLAKAELGQVKKILFNDPPSEHVFGYQPTPDAEGAREITMIWKENTPDNAYSRPASLDFTKMNKLATMSGLTTARDLPQFRSSHVVTVKTGPPAKPAPALPSEKDPKFTYGLPGTYRSAEVQREKGPFEPPVKHLVQGAYQEDWITSNLNKKGPVTARTVAYVPPVPTRAAIGHAIGAQQKYLQREVAGEEWKMKKFTTVPPRVTAYMNKTATAAAGGFSDDAHRERHEQPEQSQELAGAYNDDAPHYVA
jgi:hypothetical protein